MPELPEVEECRRIVLSLFKKHSIVAVQVAKDDPKVIPPCVEPSLSSPDKTPSFSFDLFKGIIGNTLENIGRRGKLMFMQFGPSFPMSLYIHLGMTGSFLYARKAPLSLPKYAKIAWTLDNGHYIAFMNVRKLGRVQLVNTRVPSDMPTLARLGPDLLTDCPSLPSFSSSLSASSMVLKAFLLDQSKCCGVGNWIADEVLYSARISPLRKAHECTPEQALSLYVSLQYVIQTAVAARANKNHFPSHWLFYHRWGKGKRKRETASSGSMDGLSFIQCGGRTTCFSLKLQKKETFRLFKEGEKGWGSEFMGMERVDEETQKVVKMKMKKKEKEIDRIEHYGGKGWKIFYQGEKEDKEEEEENVMMKRGPKKKMKKMKVKKEVKKEVKNEEENEEMDESKKKRRKTRMKSK